MSDANIGKGRLVIEADTSSVLEDIAALDSALTAGFDGAKASAEELGTTIDETAAGITEQLGGAAGTVDELGTSVAGVDSSLGDLESSVAAVETALGDLSTSGAETGTEIETALGGADAAAVGFGSAVGEVVAGLSGLGDNAATELGGVTAGFGEAQGGADEFGAGVETNMGKTNLALAGAGLAVGAFAFKAIGDFQDLGIKVGQFAETTGMSTEKASAWIEVSGDYGIAAETLETLFGRMNVTAGRTPELFKELGIEIGRTSTGAVDANQTFLNTIARLEQIEDPALRAETGTRIFGRGWREVSELVAVGATDINRELDSVAGNKLFTDADVTSARGLRASFDQIGDSVDELVLGLGKSLAPVIADVAPLLVSVVESLTPFLEALGPGLARAFEQVAPLIEAFADVLGFVGQFMPDANDSLEQMRTLLHGNADALANTTAGFDHYFEAVETGTITQGLLEEAILRAGGTLDVYYAKGVYAQLITDGLAESAGSAFGPFTAYAESIAKGTVTLEDNTTALDENARNRAIAAHYEDVHTTAIAEQEEAEKTRQAAMELGVEGLEEYRDAQESAEERVRLAIDAILEQNDALRSAADANFAAADATDEWTDYLADLAEEVERAEGNQSALNELYREGTRSAIEVADATTRVYEETLKANGETITATQKLDVWNQAMLNAAMQAEGPLRESIIGYIADVNGIPDEKVSDIRASVDAGSTEYATAALNAVSVARTSTIKADADDASLGAVETALGNLSRTRFVTINGKFVPNNAFASGTDNAPEGPALVGEDGPELVWLPAGSRVDTAGETASFLRSTSLARAETSPFAGTDGGMDLTLIVEGEPMKARIVAYDQARADRRRQGIRG